VRESISNIKLPSLESCVQGVKMRKLALAPINHQHTSNVCGAVFEMAYVMDGAPGAIRTHNRRIRSSEKFRLPCI